MYPADQTLEMHESLPHRLAQPQAHRTDETGAARTITQTQAFRHWQVGKLGMLREMLGYQDKSSVSECRWVLP